MEGGPAGWPVGPLKTLTTQTPQPLRPVSHFLFRLIIIIITCHIALRPPNEGEKDIKSFIECYFSSSLVIAAKISVTRAQPFRFPPLHPRSSSSVLVWSQQYLYPSILRREWPALQVDPGMLLVGDHGTVGIVP